ncbi:hypothetical protein DM01DRAFT_1405858 [Hesseltinella vesiculosa]|uniref:Uncharacterized protein n=1 Tax=Hesseltinella vesiculosa TaxID=101127 RepID=A0A1X2GP85_9FUNG|nr:hypothetical protein DM01DRAFT_1405858 [Hesseltinella vesiculosa]
MTIKPASLTLDTSRPRRLSWLPSKTSSSASSPTSAKRKSLFQLFRSSATSFDTTDEDDEELQPSTPKDASFMCIEEPKRATLIEPMAYASTASLLPSSPPPPPKHQRMAFQMQRQVLPFLQDAFVDVDAAIDQEWAQHRAHLDHLLQQPATFQFY